MKTNSSAFVHQLVLCLLVTFAVAGSTGLGTVWMRHQISTTANTNREGWLTGGTPTSLANRH